MEHGPSSNNEKMELFKSQVLLILYGHIFDIEFVLILNKIGQTIAEEIEYKICVKDEH